MNMGNQFLKRKIENILDVLYCNCIDSLHASYCVVPSYSLAQPSIPHAITMRTNSEDKIRVLDNAIDRYPHGVSTALLRFFICTFYRRILMTRIVAITHISVQQERKDVQIYTS